MKKIGIFYGTDSGNTHTIADKIAKEIGGEVDVVDVSKATKDQILGYDNLILASATYGCGDLQSDWEDMLDSFEESDFANKTIALVGVGDQDTYSDTFCDSIFYLYDKVKQGNVIGKTEVDDSYEFSDSKSVDEGKFLGLALDEDNQSELTDGRIQKWVAEIKPLFS